MDADESHSETHPEVATMLRRSLPAIVETTWARTHTLLLASIACFAASVLVDSTATLMLLYTLGGLALWVAIRHDDLTRSQTIGAFFDPWSGLPLHSALTHALADDQTMRSLSGRVAILELDISAATDRTARGDHDATNAILAAMSHRIQAHTWAESVDGPYGAMLFLRRPGILMILRRDVLDDQTSRWLAKRLVAVLNKPVPWRGEQIDPGVSITIAQGAASRAVALPALLAQNRRHARQRPAGTVQSVSLDHARRNQSTSAALFDETGTMVGRHVQAETTADIDMFEATATLLRVIDDALIDAAEDNTTRFVTVNATSLIHPHAAGEIIRRMNGSPANARLGMVLDPDFPIDPSHRAVATMQRLHQCGVTVFAHWSDSSRGVPQCSVEGLIADCEPADAPGTDVISVPGIAVITRESAAEPGPMTYPPRSRSGAERPSREGQPAQHAKASALTVR